MLDTIELSGHIQKLKELKIKNQSVQYPSIAPDWNNVENEMIEGMRMADKQVLKTIELLGMLPNLQQGNVIRKERRQRCLLEQSGGNVDWLEDFQPDETKVVEIEELLGLNNGVLFQSLNEQIESNHYNILSDLAAASFNETHNDNEDEGTSHMEDDDNDSPWNCVLYGKGKCLY